MHDWKRFLWKKWFFVRFCPHFWRCLTTFLIHFWKWVLPCKNVQKASILELIQSTFGHDLLEFVTKKYFISKEKFFFWFRLMQEKSMLLQKSPKIKAKQEMLSIAPVMLISHSRDLLTKKLFFWRNPKTLDSVCRKSRILKSFVHPYHDLSTLGTTNSTGSCFFEVRIHRF